MTADPLEPFRSTPGDFLRSIKALQETDPWRDSAPPYVGPVPPGFAREEWGELMANTPFRRGGPGWAACKRRGRA